MFGKYGSTNSRFLDNGNGLRIHTTTSGNPNNPPLFLVHGTSGSFKVFDHITERLSEDYFVVLMDLPGHGFSSEHPRDDYSYYGYREAIDIAINEFDYDQINLAGHSLGGWIAWRYAVEHPQKIGSLILIAPSGVPLGGDPYGAPEKAAAGLSLQLQSFVMENYFPRFLVKRVLLRTVSNRDTVSEATITAFWELGRLPGNRRALALSNASDREVHKVETLTLVNAPTLLIWGANDQMIPLSTSKAFLSRIATIEFMQLDGVGHMPMLEAANSVSARISSFLATNLEGDHE